MPSAAGLNDRDATNNAPGGVPTPDRDAHDAMVRNSALATRQQEWVLVDYFDLDHGVWAGALLPTQEAVAVSAVTSRQEPLPVDTIAADVEAEDEDDEDDDEEDEEDEEDEDDGDDDEDEDEETDEEDDDEDEVVDEEPDEEA